MVCDKVRIRFRKSGDLRLVSHHDLMRCFERMLRRADLPYHTTQGFNPKPRLVFALSLALGVIGCQEVVELELDAELPTDEIHARLSQQAPAGLEILDVRRIDPKAGAQVRSVRYRVALVADRLAGLDRRAADLLASPECWIERTRPQTRRFDLRPYLRGLSVLPDALEMDLWVSPNGTARPDEVMGLLGLSDVLEAGAVLERTRLELQDEPCSLKGTA
jgi:radical SAM-linked protein